MEHTLIPTIALGLLAAFIGGLIAVRLKLPAMVGYLMAGLVVGPHTPGFVGDSALAGELAEIGVMLLMFGVGLHFSLKDLGRVWRIAVPGALLQIAVATLLGTWLASAWGWPLPAGLIFGLSLSCASTVVLLKALATQPQDGQRDGHIAIGWLLVEDLVCVGVLLLLPVLTGHRASGASAASIPQMLGALVIVFGKMAALVAVMLVAGPRAVKWLLHEVIRHQSGELFTLAIVAVSVGLAYLAAAAFQVSFALGAFLAGLMINGLPIRHRVLSQLEPLQDIFSVIFFVSVGMLFNPGILLAHPVRVLAVLGIILVGKTAAAFAITRLAGFAHPTALFVAAGLAQIGEFSFILTSLSTRLGILTPDGQQLVLAGALVSIAVNPLLFKYLLANTRGAVPSS